MRLPFVGKPYVSALITDTVLLRMYRVNPNSVTYKDELLHTVLRKTSRSFLSYRYRTALGALIRRYH